MKKRLQLTVLASLFFAFAFAQGVPQGMKYQAVARNLQGAVLANQDISLRISLVTSGKPDVYYSEVHSVTTSDLGLFTLVIGAGKAEKGSFANVPWSTEEIWMEVSIKDRGATSFTTISNSKLLAVPYAFHAATASQLVNNNKNDGSSLTAGTTTSTTTANPSANWSLKGNLGSNPLTDKLGTGDVADLVIVTNNIERLRITASGDMNLANNLNVGNDLTVRQNARLNTIGGTTDIKGATNLQSTLDVSGATHLKNDVTTDGVTTVTNTTQSTATNNGALVVAGGTGIGGNLNVGGTTSLTGVTTVTSTTQSTTTSNGALVVAGGAGIGGNVNVGGTTNLNNTLGVTGVTSITNGTQSTAASNGAVVVTGGVGIGGNLNVSGSTNFGSVQVSSSMGAKGLNIVNDTASFLATFQNTNTGEGDGIKIKLGRAKSSYTIPAAPAIDAEQAQQFKDLIRCDYSGDKLTLLGNIVANDLEETGKVIAGVAVGAGNMIVNVINSALHLPLTIPDVTVPAIHLSNSIDISGPINSNLGLPISLGPYSTPAVVLPALSIDAGALGSFDIIGQTTLLPATQIIPKFQVVPALPSFSIPALDIPQTTLLTGRTVMPMLPQIDLTSIGIPSIDITSLDFWGLSFNFCLSDNAGSSPLNNNNEFIRFSDKDDNKVGSIRGVSVTNWATNYLNPSFLFKLRGALLSSKMDKFHAQYHFKNEITTALASYATIGVEYTSGNGDYAEWLERADKSELISAGDIVAVKAGKITKNLDGAEQVMVVSHTPIMLGNTPEEGKSNQGNNIAFIGQVPVKVMGPVVTGDYIIGQSSTPGYGIAKHPADMTVEDFKNAVGRSWVTDESAEPKMVNTVVGVHNNNFLSIIKDLKEKEEANDARLKAVEAKLNIITPAKGNASMKIASSKK
jgi:hypothetical protein